MQSWPDVLRNRLLGCCGRSGAWGYHVDSPGSAEPTAIACLALASRAEQAEVVRRAARWLAGLQAADGSIGIAGDVTAPHWPTALALLTWRNAVAESSEFESNAAAATRWLLAARGNVVNDDSGFAQHDTSLTGWFWVENTHSWVEPTAYAILALRAAGQGQHARVREGVRLLLDRALDDGGWNYGNRRVLGNELRPFPATSGVALTALAGETRDVKIDAAIAYLTGALRTIRAPLSLAWGVIGLRAWSALPGAADVWLNEAAERVLSEAPNPWYDALLLLAAEGECAISRRVR
ncbi:MAG: hypothetical protein U1D55_04265 [Phycisphaerae bacterium]